MQRELVGSLMHVQDEDFAAAARLTGERRVSSRSVISHRIALTEAVSGGLEWLTRNQADVTTVVVSPKA